MKFSIHMKWLKWTWKRMYAEEYRVKKTKKQIAVHKYSVDIKHRDRANSCKSFDKISSCSNNRTAKLNSIPLCKKKTHTEPQLCITGINLLWPRKHNLVDTLTILYSFTFFTKSHSSNCVFWMVSFTNNIWINKCLYLIYYSICFQQCPILFW